MNRRSVLGKIVAHGIFYFFIFCIANTQLHAATDRLDEQREALELINDFANSMCKDISLRGDASNLELTGQAKVELNNIMKKLLDMGIEGAAKYQRSEYEGLLRSDLLEALKDSTKCKIIIFQELKDDLISKNEIPDNTAHESVALSARCSASPHVVTAGEGTELIVQAISDNNSPVPDANVRVEAGGGTFTASGSTTVTGRTDYNGTYRTGWRSPNPAAPGYVMGVYVSKPGYSDAQGECHTSIQAATAKVSGGQITARCSANPYMMPAGYQTELVVQTWNSQNTPVPSANIRVDAGGGTFLASGSTTVFGSTDNNGIFRTVWRSPNPASAGYVMGVQVSKQGFFTANTECRTVIQ